MSSSSSSRPNLPNLTPAMKASLRRQIREELERRLAATANPPSLVDYVAELCPTWDRFDYFEPYAKELQRSIGAGLRLCFAAPPQHGKSELTIRSFLYLARYYPGYRHGYVTYNDDRAKTVAKLFQRLAVEAGFRVSGTLDQVELSYQGNKLSTVKFTSIGGSLTGYSLDGLCVIDDPIKDREDARSSAKRRACIEWWQSVARTRRHAGTSYVVMATRWPGGDLTDHLLKKEGWKYINLKAIAAGAANDNGVVIDDPLGRKPGESLWKRKPPEFFAEDRADLFWWSSMFQGEPTSQGLKIFAEVGSRDEDGNPMGPMYYQEVPKTGYLVAFGIDLAYTAKARADWSVCIEGVAHQNRLFIIRAIRKQVDAPTFLHTLESCATERPQARFRFYAAGTEKGAAQFIERKLKWRLRVITASADKVVRSTETSVSWNRGRILLPDPEVFDVPWLDEFLAVVTGFTGTPGETDDDVDALAALHDELLRPANKMVEALRAAAAG